MRGSAGSTASTRRITTGLRGRGTRPALVANGSEVTYAELVDRIDSVAEMLGPQRRLVQVTGGNDLDSITAYLGAIEGGHAVILTGTDAEHRESLDQRYQPDVVLSTDASRLEVVRREDRFQHDLHPDLALVLSTSGSTGSAKSVRLSHENITSNAESIAAYLQLDHTEVAITSLPLHYCYGLSVLHSHLLVGATVVLSENSVLDQCFWNAVDHHGVTSFAGVPHTFELLDRVGFTEMSVPSLRYVTQAGGRMDPAVVTRFAAAGSNAGWRLMVMYGQTEATARIAYLPPGLAMDHPDAIGIPIPGGKLRLEPTPDSPVGVGELVYEGANVMMGYAESPADLAEGRTLHELHTGDLATQGEDGLFRIVGRNSRFAKLFGLRVDLDHVEALVLEQGTEGVCVEGDGALVIAARTAYPNDLRRSLAERLSLPLSSVVVVEASEIPRLSTGKPDYRAIAALQPSAPAGSTPDPSRAGTGGPVAALFTRTLGLNHLKGTDTFVSLGGDSLSYVETSVGLESILGQLPRDWHTTPLSELESLVGGARRLGTIDTTVLLRALAIVMIVGSHAALFRFRGGAHVLLAVAGFNFARFQLTGPTTTPLASRTLRSVSRIVIPAVAWLGALAVLTTEYRWESVALLNSYLGPREWTSAWRYWFIEALVLALFACTALLSIPRIRRLEHAHQVGFAWGLLGATMLLRYDLIEVGGTVEPLLAPHRVVWFFVLGWLIQRIASIPGRLAVSAVMLFSVHGFFGETSRDTIVIVGLLLLIWVPSIALPRTISRVAGVLAAASLYIYLSHFQVFMPLLAHGVAPIYAVLASLLVGIVLWWGASAITAGASGRWAPASDYLRRVRGADGRPTKSDGGRTIVR